MIDPDDMGYQVLANTPVSVNDNSENQLVTLLLSLKVGIVVAGSCEPETLQMLSTAGVAMCLNQTGVVKTVLEKYQQVKLSAQGAEKLESTVQISEDYKMRCSGGRHRSGYCQKSVPSNSNEYKDDVLQVLRRKIDHMQNEVKKMIRDMHKS